MNLPKLSNTIKYKIPFLFCILLVAGLCYGFFFGDLSRRQETVYLYVDADDNVDSIIHKLRPIAHKVPWNGFSTLARHSHLRHNTHPGRYAVEPDMGALTLFRHIRSGLQEPIKLTIPTVRTTDRLAGALSKKLMLDSLTIAEALTNPDTCRNYGLDTLNIIGMFLPFTYEVYWTVDMHQLLRRMQHESNTFWNKARQDKAAALGLTREQVITLASIVDEETNATKEKARIAGLYYNRLQRNIPLQADPTVKYAMGNFQLRRIYNSMLRTDSPYNTYMYRGLPPGPIRIPTTEAVDAVLDMERHNYLYMCASPEFDGTHRFAENFAEHQRNAQQYAKALNQRGIK